MLHIEVLEPGTLDILRKVSAIDTFDNFCLVGGTALALQFGHRLSEDLDFFTPDPFDKELVKAELRDLGDWYLDSENRIGLRGRINTIKTDFVTYPYPLLQPFVILEEIRMFSLADIAAMKLSAITNRGAKKDFYDVYYLLQKFPLNQLCNWYCQKFTTNNLFMLLKSLTYFDDAERTTTPVLLAGTVDWQTVKKALLEEVNKY